MIQATGKLNDLTFEYVGQNETPKLTIGVSVKGQVVPFTFIGDKALSIRALTGDPGSAEGSIIPGHVVSVYGTQGFRYWEGDAERAPKTFTTELEGTDLLILGTVGTEDSSFYFQGVLHSYREEEKQGNQGTFTARTVQLMVPAHKKSETLPAANIELNVPADAAMDVQNALGQFCVVTGSVGSFTWTARSGRNAGQQQRSVKYTLGSSAGGVRSVMALGAPGWISAHGSFALPENATVPQIGAASPAAAPAASSLPTPAWPGGSGTVGSAAPASAAPASIPMTPAAAPAPMAAASGSDTPLF